MTESKALPDSRGRVATLCLAEEPAGETAVVTGWRAGKGSVAFGFARPAQSMPGGAR
jgi:hypothetical protein